jgi:hypothetical protein
MTRSDDVGRIVGDDSGADEETGGKRRPRSKLANRQIRRKSLKTKGDEFGEQVFRNQQVTRSSRVAGSNFPEQIRDLSPSALLG